MCSGLRQPAAMFMSENYNIRLNPEKYQPTRCLLLLKTKKQARTLYTHVPTGPVKMTSLVGDDDNFLKRQALEKHLNGGGEK